MLFLVVFVFSSRRRHTRCALVTGVQTCALPIWYSPIRITRRPKWPVAARQVLGRHEAIAVIPALSSWGRIHFGYRRARLPPSQRPPSRPSYAGGHQHCSNSEGALSLVIPHSSAEKTYALGPCAVGMLQEVRQWISKNRK